MQCMHVLGILTPCADNQGAEEKQVKQEVVEFITPLNRGGRAIP